MVDQIEYGVSRAVNKERGLIEAIFFSHDRDIPFLFSWMSDDKKCLSVNIFPSATIETKERQGKNYDEKPLKVEKFKVIEP